MFGTKWADLKLRLTELELRLDAQNKAFRSLESEWLAERSRNDAILKRANRLIKLESDGKKDEVFHVEQTPKIEELSDEDILAQFYKQGGR